MSKLSVIIPTKNREMILDKTLQAVLEATQGMDTEVIIVNDGPNELKIVSSGGPVRILSNKKQGVASARNTGAKAATGEWLLFLDDDILTRRENLERTRKGLEQYPGDVIGSNWVYPPETESRLHRSRFGRYLVKHGYNTLKGWRSGESWNDTKVFACDHIASAYLAITKVAFEKSGGYDEDFPHAGFEDQEFCKRLRKYGLRLYIDPGNLVYHNEEDRLEPKSWLYRKRKAGETRRVGFEKGDPAAKLTLSPTRETLLKMAIPFYSIWFAMVHLLPPWKLFDPLYFRGIHFLQALNLYIGYHK